MSTLGLVLRLLLALAVVVGLMWLLARLAARPLGRRGRGAVTVVSRQQIGRGSSLVVIEVPGETLLLGVTEQQVSVLRELDREGVRAALAEPERPARPVEHTGHSDPGVREGPLDGSLLSGATWRRAVQALRDRTVRRR